MCIFGFPIALLEIWGDFLDCDNFLKNNWVIYDGSFYPAYSSMERYLRLWIFIYYFCWPKFLILFVWVLHMVYESISKKNPRDCTNKKDVFVQKIVILLSSEIRMFFYVLSL